MNKVFINIVWKVVAVGAVFVDLVRDLFVFSHDAGEPNGRQLHDSDLIGEYNHRTGRLDAGNDPDGWYEDDM